MKSKLPDGWKKVKLLDITEKVGSGATPRGGSKVYIEKGISLIRSQNVLDLMFSTDGLVYIDDEAARKLNNVEVFNNDILLNITGDSVARTCLVPDYILPARVNQHVSIIRTDEKLSYYKFISYKLQDLKSTLLSYSSSGATRKALTKSMLENLIIELPTIKEQKAIADTLSSLDDKIELNNKINENLEQQAQTIFKHWFVDFEFPDEEGKPYKSSAGKMIESELGMIPIGWKVRKLGCISERDNKSIRLPSPGLYKHFSIPAFEDKKLPILEDGLTIKSNKYLIDNNHILISRLNPRFKRLWRPVCFGENNVCSTEFIVVKAKESKLRNLVYSIMDSSKFYDFMLQNVTGATNSHQRVSPPSIILDYKLALPQNDLMDVFTDIINPIYKKINNNIRANQTLSKLRDTLLPKLMSGEIRIPLD